MGDLLVLTIANGGGLILIDQKGGKLFCRQYPEGVTLAVVPEHISTGEVTFDIVPEDPSIEIIRIVTKPVTRVQKSSVARALETGVFSPIYTPNGGGAR